MIGGKIGFFQGDIKLFLNDLKELGPTILCTVPRIVNRIYSTVSSLLNIQCNLFNPELYHSVKIFWTPIFYNTFT